MKLNSRGFGIVGVLILLLVAAAFGGLSYLAYAKITASDEPLLKTETVKPTGKATPEAIITNIKTKLAKSYPTKMVDGKDTQSSHTPATGALTITVREGSAFYKVDGYDFLATAHKGASISVLLSDVDYAENDSVVKGVDKIFDRALMGAGLTVVADKDLTNEFQQTFKSDTAVCQTLTAGQPVNPRFVDCSSVADLTAAAQELKPFADAYATTETEPRGKPLLFSLQSIQDSATPGYKRARLGISTPQVEGGTSGLFYKKGGGEWKYLASSQMGYPCSEYDSDPDAIKAFKGDQCYIGDGGETRTIE